jgi:hypothetical protein
MKTIAKAANTPMPINSQFIVDHSTPADARRMLGPIVMSEGAACRTPFGY